MQAPVTWPDRIETEEQLDDLLATPSPALVKFISTLSSPLIVLGAGGKMGPTLAILAKRAAIAAGHSLDVIAVSRFSNSASKQWLESRGVRTLTCDLLDRTAVQQLPDAENLVYMVGLKFGTAQNPASTWAINTVVPVRIAERYPNARLVALSTGNVYPLSQVAKRGSLETDPLTPLGEYANAAVGRERVFEFFSTVAAPQRSAASSGTAKLRIAQMRLFYAIELRYGVLVDIATKVHADKPVDLATAAFNCIWQADANEMVLRALALADSPPSVWNLCRPEIFKVRAVAEQFGALLGRPPHFEGAESSTALLGNSDRLCHKLGPPAVPLEQMLKWIAHWVKLGGRNLGKPTHFEVRNGAY